MSADNMIIVWEHTAKENVWCVAHAFASPIDSDCQHIKHIQDELSEDSQFSSRGAALAFAHDRAKEETVLEYGVCEVQVHTEPCGQCHVCVFDRGIIAAHVKRCDTCQTPLIDWAVGTGDGWFCNSCARERDKKVA